MFNCQYCNKECKSKLSKSAHERFCKLNPNYEQNIKVHIEKVSSKGGQAAIKTVKEKAVNDPLNQIHSYKIICFRCGKEYVLNLKERDYLHRNYRKTCSSKCAKSRALSKETKKKIGESIKKEHEHICPKCGIKFLHKGTGSHTLCPKCYFNQFEHNRNNIKKIKSNLKEIKERINVCKLCGKIYTFNKSLKLEKGATVSFCCKEHFIEWRSNRKKYDPEYCEKMSALTKKLMAEGKIKPWQTRNIKSYAERFFEKVLSLNKIQFQREKKVDKYFLDFVIKTPNRIIDFEVDGKQHWNDPERVESDKIRDEYLTTIGYSVYRLPWNEINSTDGKSLMKDKIAKFLDFYKNSFI